MGSKKVSTFAVPFEKGVLSGHFSGGKFIDLLREKHEKSNQQKEKSVEMKE